MTQQSAEMIQIQFAGLAVQYFVAGRAAAINQLIPVLGNLLHHAVEMALKAALASSLSLPDLKKLGHQLPKIWSSFKATCTVDAAHFDSVVAELHRFENIRYPDLLLQHGAQMEFILLREHIQSGQRSPSIVPRYRLVLEDVDELMEFIFEAAKINPHFFTGSMSESAKDFLSRHNRYASKW